MSDHLDELHIRRLLVAVDGSDSSTLALRAAITVARRDNAALTLLCVAPDAAHDMARFAVTAGVPPTTQDELDAEAEKILRRTVALVPDEIPIRTVVRRGKPGPAIVAHAREENYDAILVGARGVGRVASIVGSVSAYVLSHADVDVFVAHSAA
ncbi:MAG TPA: universal stress protein [Solirubrobacteraceae bacterium]|nr:universal stress protein [Solirubrobacteraceae bacterium]